MRRAPAWTAPALRAKSTSGVPLRTSNRERLSLPCCQSTEVLNLCRQLVLAQAPRMGWPDPLIVHDAHAPYRVSRRRSQRYAGVLHAAPWCSPTCCRCGHRQCLLRRAKLWRATSGCSIGIKHGRAAATGIFVLAGSNLLLRRHLFSGARPKGVQQRSHRRFQSAPRIVGASHSNSLLPLGWCWLSNSTGTHEPICTQTSRARLQL